MKTDVIGVLKSLFLLVFALVCSLFLFVNFSVQASTEGVAEIESVEKAPPGWYNPVFYSENIECKKGYDWSKKNMDNGKCRVRWDIIQNNVTNQMINSLVSGFGRKGH